MTRAEEKALELMRGEGRGAKDAAALAGLWALSKLYAAGIGAYWGMYRAGLLKRVRLRPVVVSVGNLTVGGTGKTTAIQYLARFLQRQGFRVAILSYGYRAASRDAAGIVSDGVSAQMGVEEAGDEATLLARSVPGVPVLIGRRRVVSGAVADERFRPDVLLCDDAFQYWRLERDLDLLLVDAVEPWGYGHVLPRGLLREPKRQARRADGILVTHADLSDPAALSVLDRDLGRFGRPVWHSRHEPRDLEDMVSGERLSLETLDGAKVLAVSSLGDPKSFEDTLRALGADVAWLRFPDHHGYTPDDVRSVEAVAADQGRTIVTTAKDAVKLRRFETHAGWKVLEIALAVHEEESFQRWLLQAVKTAHEKNGTRR